MTSTAAETRWPCPVCLGATLKKVRLRGGGRELVLDACERCGGIWFELGEVQRLRAHPPAALWRLVQRRTDPVRGACHFCHARIDRNAETCEVCGKANRIDCPSCATPLTVETHQHLRLDVCHTCKGVWFDHAELATIWRLSLESGQAVRRGGGESAGEIASSVALDALIFAPDLVVYGAARAGMAVAEGGAHLVGAAPEALGAVASGAGELAGGAFEAILEIIGGIFDGL